MGKFYSATITTTDPTERATSISNWFNEFEGISSEVIDYEHDSNTYASANVSINDTNVGMLFGIKNNAVGTSVVHVNNGSDELIEDTVVSGANSSVTNAKLYAYISEDCIMLSVFQGNSYNPSYNGVEIVYVKTSDNKHLIGYYLLSTNSDFADISLLKFKDVADSVGLIHSYTNMFPFAAIAGQVDFLNQAYFVQANPGTANATKSFRVDVLRECSTVTLLSTVSLPYPLNNHLAIGAHCIVPLDDEEEVNE